MTNREIAEGVVAQWFLHEWVNQQPRPEEVGRDKLVTLIEAALEQRVEELERANALAKSFLSTEEWLKVGRALASEEEA